MHVTDVRRLRVAHHRIAGEHGLETPHDVVRCMGALQAQDYRQSLWAVGSRLRDGTAAQVEQAIADGRIIRTWPMRGTIHLVPAEDVRWMLALGTPRVRSTMDRRLRQLQITTQTLDRSAAVLGPLLADGPMSRPDLMSALESAGIATDGQRGVHVLGRLAHDGLLCIGPQQGTAQTFALLDQWAPPATAAHVDPDEAVALLARRYARGRAPVTTHDFARWSGLTVAVAADGLRRAHETWPDETTAATPSSPAERTDDQPGAVHLLAGFDEYVIGYKGRDEVLSPEHFEQIVPGGNGIFRPLLVRDGAVVGTWQRALSPRSLTVTLRPFEQAGAETLATQATEAIARYRRFLSVADDVRTEVVVEQ